MNLEEYTKKTRTTELSVSHRGKDITFHIKPLMSGDQEVILEGLGDLMSIQGKSQAAEKEGKLYIPTGQEFKDLQTYDRKVTQFVLCNSEGKRSYNSYASMVGKIESNLLTKISDKIKDELETPEDTESAEGN